MAKNQDSWQEKIQYQNNSSHHRINTNWEDFRLLYFQSQ
jgi:hypothetical protein